jgi:hypothetical protein
MKKGLTNIMEVDIETNVGIEAETEVETESRIEFELVTATTPVVET